jgi:aspartyl aminopeptidase
MSAALDHVADLAAFVAASPSSHHAVSESARRLAAAGFAEQQESAAWSSDPGGHYLVRDGALIAWRIPSNARSLMPFRILGSHTDSTGFTLYPRPDISAYGWQQV